MYSNEEKTDKITSYIDFYLQQIQAVSHLSLDILGSDSILLCCVNRFRVIGIVFTGIVV
jgi:hypothetical protein